LSQSGRGTSFGFNLISLILLIYFYHFGRGVSTGR